MIKGLTILLFTAFSFVATWFITERVKAPEEAMLGLYEAHNKPCMNYWTTDTAFIDTASLQAQAMKLYDEGEYTLAIEAFQRFEPEPKDEALYNLYLGICYLESDFANLAVFHFGESQVLFKKFEMIQMSKWYQALAYLKCGQEKEAVKNLKEIVEVNAPQRYKSEIILTELDLSRNPLKSIVLAFNE